MNKTVLFVVGGLVAFVLVVAGTLFASYVSANNYGAQIEAQLRAQYSNNQNILTSYYQKIKEAAQVPDMYAEDLKKVTTAAIQGRYGDKGSQATFQWLKEQNPQLDVKVYTKLQQIIEAGRDEFKNGQSKMLDVKRQYEAQQGFFWRGMWLRIAGYPKEDMSKYVPVIVNEVETAFKSGKEAGPVKLR